MKLLLFSFDATTDVDTPQKLVGIDTAMQAFDALPAVQNSFLGFNLKDDLSIQFVYQEDGSILVDVPDPEQGGSLQKTVNTEGCKQIIERLYSGKNAESIAGLQFVEW